MRPPHLRVLPGPQKVGVALTDILTGLYACNATLAALTHRDRNEFRQDRPRAARRADRLLRAVFATLAIQTFTLAWTHSIEKVHGEKDWRIEGQQLQIVEARIRCTGSDMEPPPDAVLRDGAWHYRPGLRRWIS